VIVSFERQLVQMERGFTGCAKTFNYGRYSVRMCCFGLSFIWYI